MAAVACPVGAIGGAGRAEMREGTGAFPQLIADNVYHCGYYSAGSYGSASYLVVRPEGNLLIDSPCFARQLVRRIEELGGVATMFLSHRDDVADHQKFQRHFGCERIMHAADIGHGTWDVEVPIEGSPPRVVFARPLAAGASSATAVAAGPGRLAGARIHRRLSCFVSAGHSLTDP